MVKIRASVLGEQTSVNVTTDDSDPYIIALELAAIALAAREELEKEVDKCTKSSTQSSSARS